VLANIISKILKKVITVILGEIKKEE